MIARFGATGNFNGQLDTLQVESINPTGMTSTVFWASNSSVLQTSLSINGEQQGGSQGYTTMSSASAPGSLLVNASQTTPSVSGRQGEFGAPYDVVLMTQVADSRVAVKPGAHPQVRALLPPARIIPLTFTQAAAPVTPPASGSQVPPYAMLLPPLASTTTIKGTVPIFSNPFTSPYMNITGILVDGAPISFTPLPTDQLFAFSAIVPAGKTASFLMNVAYPERAGNVQGSLVVEPM